jgi:hypothetical protein
MNIKLDEIQSKQEKLKRVSKKLKKDFIGIDNIIDEVIDQVRAWYILPQILSRPVIINLWGMTGIGKTNLVRKLVKYLDFLDKFAEIDLSQSFSFGFYGGLRGVFSQMSIKSSEQNIVLFDEFQKFRTITEDGKESGHEKLDEFWELLSDGKISKKKSIRIVEEFVAESLFDLEERKKDPKDKGMPYDLKKPWNSYKLSDSLGGAISYRELFDMQGEELVKKLQKMIKFKEFLEPEDYSRTLIIISGNLDEAYRMAVLTDEAEVDADVFHAQSSKISVVDIKNSLKSRFRPEQISRLGNIHVIYPSLRKMDFKLLIKKRVSSVFEKFKKYAGLKIKADQSIYDLVYKNGVFPV